jgi:hypothetical protein
MATLAQLEEGLKRAYEAGNMEYARILAAEVVKARKDPVNQIPGIHVEGTPEPDPTLGQRVVGGLETAATMATGATGGALGYMGGTIAGVGRQIVQGRLGDSAATQEAARTAQNAASALTYSPRTAAGQSMTQTAAGALEQAFPAIPAVGPAGQITQSIKAAAPAVVAGTRAATAPAVRAADKAVKAARENAVAQQAGGPGARSISAAEVDSGKLAQAKADELPVPIKLTEGQRTRNFEQQRFERETAKNPELGAPIRERMEQQQKQMLQNLETYVEMTGSETRSLRDAGVAVNDALRAELARAKQKERVLYKAAEKAGEMQAPVKTDSLIQFIKENDSFNTSDLSGATLGLLEKELVRLGGAKRGPDGQLIPGELTLANMELLRRQLNSAINAKMDNQTNMRTGVQAKELIDALTEGVGGDAYKKARAARAERARNFENVTLVSSLLGTKRGSSDRSIALEDVVRKSVLSPSTSLDQTRHLGMLLKKTPQGQQAWKELQGATMQHIRDEAFGGVTTDSSRNPVISPAKLNKVINDLDKNGKLDYLFGKKGAEQLRTLNEVAKDVFTAPPGAVNTSTTASVLMDALDAAVTFGVTGIPAPAMKVLNASRKAIQERETRMRVEEALR